MAAIRHTDDDLSRAAQDTLAQQAERMAQAAREYAPVDTGALRDSISSRMEGGEAVISASVPYAAAVELGSFARAPRPFLSPAYQALKQETIEAVARAVQEELSL